MEENDGRSGWSCWTKGCVGGCGCLVVVLVIYFTVGGLFAYRMAQGFNQASEASETLKARYAESPFVPPADGRIPPDRLETYLRVRRSLAPACSELDARFAKLDDIDRGEGPPTAARVFDMLRTAVNVPAGMSGIFQARGQALLDAGMSEEEFFWWTALLYCTAEPTLRPEDVSPDRPIGLGRRMNELLRDLFRQQLEAARAAGPDAVGADWLEVLEAESDRLAGDENRGPWDDGLPPRILEPLEPHAAELRELYCGKAEHFLTDVVETSGMSIRVQ